MLQFVITRKDDLVTMTMMKTSPELLEIPHGRSRSERSNSPDSPDAMLQFGNTLETHHALLCVTKDYHCNIHTDIDDVSYGFFFGLANLIYNDITFFFVKFFCDKYYV